MDFIATLSTAVLLGSILCIAGSVLWYVVGVGLQLLLMAAGFGLRGHVGEAAMLAPYLAVPLFALGLALGFKWFN